MISLTALILAYNEKENIGRTIAALKVVPEIVIIDSGSNDGTIELARTAHQNVRVVQREFDSHPNQWNFGLDQVATEWVLTLDADYEMSPQLAAEIQALNPSTDQIGYWAEFEYRIYGHPLRGSSYPPRIVLFKPACARYVDDGHTQTLWIGSGEQGAGSAEQAREQGAGSREHGSAFANQPSHEATASREATADKAGQQDYRTEQGTEDTGHKSQVTPARIATQSVAGGGQRSQIGKLTGKIYHDDRKPLSRWIQEQDRYSKLEARHLLRSHRSQITGQKEDFSWPDRLRLKIFFAAPVMFLYLLFVRGLILDGWPGWFYVGQRTIAELLLSMRLLIESKKLEDRSSKLG